MYSFVLWLRESDDIHPILEAGIAHVPLVAIYPFWDGHGPTARGLATMILQRSDFGFQKLLSLEASLFSIQNLYFAAIFQTLGKAFSKGYDATAWVEFFVQEVAWNGDSLPTQLTDWQKGFRRIQRIFADRGWNQRQADAFAFAHQAGRIARGEHMDITGVSPVTASRDPAQSVKFGVFTAAGKTRRRVYRMVSLSD